LSNIIFLLKLGIRAIHFDRIILIQKGQIISLNKQR
jgi:hypothetical protein